MSDVIKTDTYSSVVGAIYVYNLIVGLGSLTLPSVFLKAGWGISIIVLLILALMGYMTITFIIESMACANAIIQLNRSNTSNTDIVNPPETEVYSLEIGVEFSDMSQLFFEKFGRFLFYLAMCAYLYGNLSIYIVAVTQSLTDVCCSEKSTDYNKKCWESSNMSKMTMYRIMVTTFVLVIGPFSYFNVQKTKYLQIITTIIRWCALLLMIGLSINRIVTLGAEGHPPFINYKNIPELIGCCVYSFMCHHSIPVLITPISDKSHLLLMLAIDQILICSFYLLLGLTGSFAFEYPKDIYTLNFIPSNEKNINWPMQVVKYFLSLFPVLTLSTTFPIICISLHSNLKSLFIDESSKETHNFVVRRLVFPTLALIPPTTVAILTYNIKSLVGFTATYGGSAIQYIIPSFLVFYARRACKQTFGDQINKYRSPFQGIVWIYIINLWCLICVVLSTIHLIFQHFL